MDDTLESIFASANYIRIACNNYCDHGKKGKSEMLTEAQKRAKRKYAAKVKRYVIDLYPTEQPLIDWLSKQERPQTYLKDLIKKDMRG